MSAAMVPLGALAEINPRAPRSLLGAPRREVSFVPMAAVSEEGCLREPGARAVAEVAKGYTYFERGDVLLAKITPCMENGKAVHLNELQHECGFGSTELHVLRAREGVDGRYLFYLLWNPAFRRIAEQHMTGTAGQKRLPASFLEGFRAPIVPLPEQRRIVKALDKASCVLRRRKEAIALTDALVRSAFLEMFGDPVANPRQWPVLTIGDLCRRGASLVDGPFGSSLKPEHYVPAGIRVVRNWNIRDDAFDASQQKYVTPDKFEAIRRSEVAPDDILITTKGTVGDVCLMPPLEGPSVLSATGTARLRLPKDGPLLAPFVVGQMIVPTYKRYLRSFEAGSAQHYLNLAALRGMRLIVPDIAAQERFVAARRRARELKDNAQQAALEAESLWSSLTRRALRGELAVRDRGAVGREGIAYRSGLPAAPVDLEAAIASSIAARK